MSKKAEWGIVTLSLLLGLGSSRGGEAQDNHRVQAKDKKVVKNDKIDYADEEATNPDTVESFKDAKGKELIRLVSKTFVPPDKWKFKLFPDAPTHVDIWANPEGLGFDRLKDTDTEIKIRGIFPTPKNAGNFPLRGEGNLQPPGGGGGSGGGGGLSGTSPPPEFHWSAKVQDIKIDLDIIKPDGAELDEAIEDTEGEVLQVNIDDDNDNAKSDKDDDKVAKENDLLRLKLHKVEGAEPAGGVCKLHFESDKIKIWKKDDKTDPVLSDVTIFPADKDTIVFVEGLDHSASLQGEKVTLRLVQGENLIAEDRVKIIVAEIVIAIFGDGGSGESELRAYLEKEKKDQRTDPYIVKTEKACFSVSIWKTEKLAKLALAAKDSYLVYDGHSNYGIGFAFSQGLKDIASFMNVGQDFVAINWPYMREKQGHPNFMIEDAEYGDDLKTAEKYDPWRGEQKIVGRLTTLTENVFYDHAVSPGQQLHLTRGTPKFRDWHDDYGGADNKRIIAKGGSADMPQKRWKKIFMNSCLSGRYYYAVFNRGTLFYTGDECALSPTTMAFIKAIVDGKDDDGILKEINKVEDLNDYHAFLEDKLWHSIDSC